MSTVRDPVCGMELEPGGNTLKIKFNDKEYYFCSNSCKELFEKLNGLKSKGMPDEPANERKMIAYNTLKQLTATIAHYIGNANTVINAQAQIHNMPIIKDQSDKIDSIVNALLSITDIKLRKYIESEEDAIIDLKNTIEDELMKKKET